MSNIYCPSMVNSKTNVAIIPAQLKLSNKGKTKQNIVENKARIKNSTVLKEPNH